MRSWWLVARSGLGTRPGRPALLALITAVAVALMVSLQVIVVSWDAAVIPVEAGTGRGADWVVRPRGAAAGLPPELVAAVRALPEVAWAAPRTALGAVTGAAGGGIAGTQLVDLFTAGRGVSLPVLWDPWVEPAALAVSIALLAVLPVAVAATRLPAATALRQE